MEIPSDMKVTNDYQHFGPMSTLTRLLESIVQVLARLFGVRRKKKRNASIYPMF
jgi:hypothetical protein